MAIARHHVSFLIFILLLTAACSPATPADLALPIPTQPAADSQPGETGPDRPADPPNPDAAIFAEDAGITLEEANQRLVFQETIGDIQPQLMSDLGDTYGGLWVEHEPAYRIVIALTEGDQASIRPYIEGQDWAGYVEVIHVDYTLEELTRDQAAAGRAAETVHASVTTAVDVIHNRVELWVGNPELFQNDLIGAGLRLPPSVVISAFEAGGDLPESNQGLVLEAPTADGRTIYLPKQAPTDMSMAALIEGDLIEVNGCLRLTSADYEHGFLVIWRNDADIRVAGDLIEVLDGRGQPIARVGQPLRAGGGAIESPTGYGRLEESIPGLPIEGCPGPYWVIATMETVSPPLGRKTPTPEIYHQP